MRPRMYTNLYEWTFVNVDVNARECIMNVLFCICMDLSLSLKNDTKLYAREMPSHRLSGI